MVLFYSVLEPIKTDESIRYVNPKKISKYEQKY